MAVAVPTAAVIGHPVGHSLSPLIHQHWLRELGLAGDYLAHDVAPPTLLAAIKNFADRGYCGLNVTIPHKETARALCDEVSPAARAIGAVNTILFRDDNIVGDNTDAAGFAAHLMHEIPMPTLTHVTIIGAGGAARAIVVALKHLGAKNFTILNRDVSRAEKLVEELEINGTAEPLAFPISPLTSLLVNCTSLGMTGQPPLPMELSSLPHTAIVADIVYRPLQTELLTTAAGCGHKTVDGLGMLIHQAALAFEQFYGMHPVVKPGLRARLEQELA